MNEVAQLLTPAEHDAMAQTAQLTRTMREIIGDGPAAEGDIAEMVDAVHRIQRMVLGQAAARAYPERYRLLGGDAPQAGDSAGDGAPPGNPYDQPTPAELAAIEAGR